MGGLHGLRQHVLLVIILGVIGPLALSGCGSTSAGSPKSGPSGSLAVVSKSPATSSGPTAGAAAAKLPAPCSLISASEATASLGYSVTSRDSSADNDPDQISCVYLKGSHPALVVLIRRWTLAHFAEDAAREPGKPQPVASVGTSAYLGATEDGPVVLVWERGVSVAVSGVSPITADQVKFLAKVAVGQLDSPS